jgi:hypothetical protein
MTSIEKLEEKNINQKFTKLVDSIILYSVTHYIRYRYSGGKILKLYKSLSEYIDNIIFLFCEIYKQNKKIIKAHLNISSSNEKLNNADEYNDIIIKFLNIIEIVNVMHGDHTNDIENLIEKTLIELNE